MQKQVLLQQETIVPRKWFIVHETRLYIPKARPCHDIMQM